LLSLPNYILFEDYTLDRLW